MESLEPRHLLAGDVIISEFVARNDSTLVDESGDSSDWIELFNRGDVAVDLDGWYLTDDADDLDRWRIPARSLLPAESLVVFASGKDLVGDELHTDFRLSGGGEYLGLIAPDASTIVSEYAPEFPPQLEDIAFGVEMQTLVADPGGDLTSPVIAATLVSRYEFDDPNRLGDDQGSFNIDATIVGDARFSSAARSGAGALFLDGDGDLLEIANSGTEFTSVDDNGSGFTFAAWIQVDRAVAGNRRLFSIDMEGGPFLTRGWGVGLRDDNGLLATTYSRADYDDPSGAAVEDGRWQHVAYVYEPSAGTVEFFIDGVSTGVANRSPAGLNDSFAADDYVIGGLNLTSTGNGQFFRGLIDDVRIYDGPLTESQVAALASSADSLAATVRYIVPDSDQLGTAWTQLQFDDANWMQGVGALGYEVNPTEISDYVGQQIPAGSTSVYLRETFEIDEAAEVSNLLLRLRYDDGFVAYVNGVQVVSDNAPGNARFDSLATVDRDNSLAPQWSAFDLSEYTNLLVDGENVLAIHGLNASQDSGEFLIVPNLIAIADRPVYLLDATPGETNTLGNDFGPLIEDVDHRIDELSTQITVTASISELSAPVSGVDLHYRVMYGDEVTLAMNDAGLEGDQQAGDGVFSAQIPGGIAQPGEMVRYYVTTTDSEDRALRSPFLPDPSDAEGFDEYYGTVLPDPSAASALPVLQWFVPDPTWHMLRPGNPGGGNNRDWTPASVYFAGELYDNIRVRVRGSATVQGWAKPKFKFEFNDSHEFRYAPDQERVDEFNLQSHYVEVLPGAGLGSTAVSYMRETLAYQFLQEIGAPASTAFHMRVQQNGEFYSLASFIEQVDRTFLRRNGFNDEGAMYKATPTVQSTLAPNPRPGVYRKVTRRDEPFDDLSELTDGINGRLDEVSIEQYLFDNVNLPEVINLMAGQTILMNHDRLTKNYYVHQDPETGLWSRFPWDVEQAFSDPQWEHFVSVLYGDSEHTQGTGNQPQYPNYLLDAILDTPRSRQMFLERVRTLMNRYLGETTGYFEERIDELAALIGPEAELDNQRWRAGSIETGVQSIKDNLQTRREALAADRLVPDRSSVVREVELLPLGAAVSALVPTSPASGVVDNVQWYAGDASFADTAANGWVRGTTGVGYDTRSGYDDYIGLDVGPLMDSDGDGTNDLTSVYTRMDFEVTDPESFSFLDLRLRYDDGFVAYLNGHEVASDKMPDPPAWDSVSTRAGEARDPFVTFEIGTMLPDGGGPVLVPGTNVLAVHLVNRRATDSDLLLQPMLVGGIAEPRVFDLQFGVPDDDGVEEADEIVFNPVSGNQDEEYISIINRGNAAVDLSGWSIDGGARVTFQPGTVLPADSTLYVTPDLNAFRNRSTGPSGLQGLFVQTLDAGHLSNFGETLTLRAPTGERAATVTTPNMPSSNQRFLRVSEINYNPTGSDDATEFIELANTSAGVDATTLDLSGVAITEGPSEPFVFPAGTQLGAGQHVVVVGNEAAFRARYPNVGAESIAGQFVGRLDNGGETLKVEDQGGSTILEFNYGDGMRWPRAADGVGASLEAINPADADRETFGYPSRWRSSYLAGGTPAAPPVEAPTVLINEVRSRSAIGTYDAIELYNFGTESVDIGGWSLSDSSDDLDKFQIPAGTVIAAGGYIVFDERQFNPNPEQPLANHFALNDEGDEVWLTSRIGTRTFVDDVHFRASDQHSLGRTSAANHELVPQARATFGAHNRGVQFNDVVISEVNYHPFGVSPAAWVIDPDLTPNQLEFIELRNNANRAVRLSGWRLDGAVEFSFDPEFELPLSGRVLIVSFNPDSPNNAARLSAFRTQYGLSEDVPIIGGYGGNLSDREELLRVLRPIDPTLDPTADAWVVVDQMSYEDRGIWPASADGQGDSLQRNFSSNNGRFVASWRADLPTPGVANGRDFPAGDMTGDGLVTNQDIDRLFDAVYNDSAYSVFDLDGNRQVDQNDVEFLIQSILQTTPGDANLDRRFSSSDLVLAFQAGGYEDDLIGNSTWSTGDWTGDAEFSTADLVYAFQFGLYVG